MRALWVLTLRLLIYCDCCVHSDITNDPTYVTTELV